MFGNLFSGMNVGRMDVNFNFQTPQGFPGMQSQMPMNLVGLSSFPQISDQSGIQEIPYKQLGEPGDHLRMYTFKESYINGDYKLRFIKEFDFKANLPKNRFENINPHYRIHQNGKKRIEYPDTGEVFADIEIRETNKSPVLTMIDTKDIEDDDKGLIDQIFYHTFLISKFLHHDHFYFIDDHTGETESDEPILTINNKGISFRAVIRIDISEIDLKI